MVLDWQRTQLLDGLATTPANRQCAWHTINFPFNDSSTWLYYVNSSKQKLHSAKLIFLSHTCIERRIVNKPILEWNRSTASEVARTSPVVVWAASNRGSAVIIFICTAVVAIAQFPRVVLRLWFSQYLNGVVGFFWCLSWLVHSLRTWWTQKAIWKRISGPMALVVGVMRQAAVVGMRLLWKEWWAVHLA